MIYDYPIVKQLKEDVYVIEDDGKYYVLKQYHHVTRFNKELRYSQYAKEHNITLPFKFDKKQLVTMSKYVSPLVNEHGHLIDKKIMTPQFIDLIDRKIARMHQLGFAHGDLSVHNIVYDKNEPFIIDFEYAYQINNHTKEVEQWMERGYNWDKSYADFVNFDYIHCRNSLSLPTDKAPRDYVRLEEEYLYQ